MQLESLIRSRKERLKLGLTRFGVNVLVIVFIILAGYTIFEISSMSLKPHKKNADVTKLEKLAYGFAPSILISFYNLIFPIILGKVSFKTLQLELPTRCQQWDGINELKSFITAWKIRKIFRRNGNSVAAHAGSMRPAHGCGFRCLQILRNSVLYSNKWSN
jgi:hypothetical protein